MVVLGALRKTDLASVLGSVTRWVVSDCSVPVLVVPTASRVSTRELQPTNRP